MTKIEVLQGEWDLLKQELSLIEEEKTSIRDLGLTANEQLGETFGHDNPILESKAEKERLLALRIQAKGDILSQIRYCDIIPDDTIKERKKQDKISLGAIQGGLGSIYRLRYDQGGKEMRGIMTGLVQGKEIKFDGNRYKSFSQATALGKALLGKSNGESGGFSVDGKNISFSILDIE